MSDYREATDNVQAFLDKTSADIGRMKEEEYSSFFHLMIRNGMKSPIEDLFFIAFCAQAEAEQQELNPRSGGEGVFIEPQFQIGQFRVDFLACNTRKGGIAAVIELDGHDFHDRDKHQRAYEKARDRFFVKQGFKVLHFTGSEIVSDPHKAAFEVLSVIDGVITRKEYDPKFPLGEPING